jgi:hypothetical protein
MSRTALCSDRVLLNDWPVVADLTNLSPTAPFHTRLPGVGLTIHCRGRYRGQAVRNGSGEPVNSDSRYGF